MNKVEFIKSIVDEKEFKQFCKFNSYDKHLYYLKLCNNLKKDNIILPSEWYDNKYNNLMSFRQIAKELNMNVSNVITIYHTAMFKIKLYLESKELYSLYDFYEDSCNTQYDSEILLDKLDTNDYLN